jgi:hypothetical protein
MPTYQMAAPNGQTYQVDGPEGANDDAVRTEILRQHPDAGTAATAPKKPGVVDQVVGAARQYGASIAKDYGAADQAYRQDAGALVAKVKVGQAPNPLDNAKPILDMASAALSPVTGAFHQAFGDQPLHLPAQVGGVLFRKPSRTSTPRA